MNVGGGRTDTEAIPAGILEEARLIELRARRLVNTLMAGGHPSIFKGRGMEFQEIRVYRPGDDVRCIDWKTTAKLTAPHVRVSAEEKELPVTFIADLSASMDYGSGELTKRRRMAEAVALLGLAAVWSNNPLSLIAFTDCVEYFQRPRRGARALTEIVARLLSMRHVGRGSDMDEAVDAYMKARFKKGTAFLLSDFHGADFGLSLKSLAVGFDVVPVVIRDPREERLPPSGFVELFDLETGERTVVDTLDPGFRRFFESRGEDSARRMRAAFTGAGLDWIELSNSPERRPFGPIREFFMRRR